MNEREILTFTNLFLLLFPLSIFLSFSKSLVSRFLIPGILPEAVIEEKAEINYFRHYPKIQICLATPGLATITSFDIAFDFHGCILSTLSTSKELRERVEKKFFLATPGLATITSFDIAFDFHGRILSTLSKSKRSREKVEKKMPYT
jgi:hypothetical protein